MRDIALSLNFSRSDPAGRYHLTASQCETISLALLLETADTEDRGRRETTGLGYSDPRGLFSLREAIAGGYHQADAETMPCFAGTQEAVHAAMHAKLGEADHIIVVTPDDQSSKTIPLGLCAVTAVAFDPIDRWSLDIDAVEAAIRPNTKVIAVNFANSPTGKILERPRFDAVVALCRRHGLWLFSDEVHRLIERKPEMRLPAAVDVCERGISLGIMSKANGLPGRWIVCRDRALLHRMERLKHYLSGRNSVPSELLAQIALIAGDDIMARGRQIATRNVEHLNAFFEAYPTLVEWYVPDGGVVGYPIYKGPEGVEQFCARLIEEDGVMLLPASLCRSDLPDTPLDRFRMGFGRPDRAHGLDAMKTKLDRVAAFLSQKPWSPTCSNRADV